MKEFKVAELIKKLVCIIFIGISLFGCCKKISSGYGIYKSRTSNCNIIYKYGPSIIKVPIDTLKKYKPYLDSIGFK